MSRPFLSRDPGVRGIIAQCEAKLPSNHTDPTDTCRITLQCILNSVDAYVQGRWSAGASILAFIPTIVVLMSNSIEEVALIAEESPLLAFVLCVCSMTVFTTRFGISSEANLDSEGVVKEDLEYVVPKAFEATKDERRRKARRRRVALTGAIVALLGCCAAIWIPARMIVRNGVVVYSCEWTVHVPIWIALTQALSLANVFFGSVLWDRKVTALESKRLSSPKTKSKSRVKSMLNLVVHPARKLATPVHSEDAWPAAIVLRSGKTTVWADSVRLMTSILSVGLYTFSTAVLAGMTMFTASDAIRCMALFTVSAGVGRLIGSRALARHGSWRSTLVYNVHPRAMESLQRYAEEKVDQH